MTVQYRDRGDKKDTPRVRLSTINVDDIYILFLYFKTKVLIVKWDKPRTPKQWYRQNMYKLALKLRRFEKKFIHWYKMNFDDDPIYYCITSIDCDCVEMSWVGKSDDYRAHFQWLNDDSGWDWVEGRTSVDIISEEEYLQEVNEPVKIYDHIMAAYENGNGRNIII